MGYDLHVVRTEQWADADRDPILKSEVDALFASDSSLSWSTTDYVDMREDDGTICRYFLINWNGVPTFWWYRSEITCKNPDDRHVLKLVEIADALGAHVIGDDGERYHR